MRLLSLLALLPSVVYTATVQPNTNAISPQINGSFNGSSIPNQLVNATTGLTTGLGFVDPRLTIDPRVGQQAINSISAYMTTIGLLSTLAVEDFDGQMTSQSFRGRVWPGVRVKVKGVDDRPLPRRFAIWGLLFCMIYMSKTSFTNDDIYLLWEGVRVGLVQYFHTREPNSPQAAGSPDSLNGTEIAGLDDLSATQTFYKPNGKDLSRAGTYISLASALVQLAENEVGAPMPPVGFNWWEFNTRITVSGAIRASPPHINVGNGLAMVWETAKYVTQQRRYAEYTSVFYAQNILIGKIDGEYIEENLAAPEGVATT